MNPKLILLMSLAARAALHQPATAARLTKFIESAKASLDDADVQAKLDDLQKRAASDPVAYRELQSLKIRTITNFITVKSNAATFFENTELKDDEVPYVENQSTQETKARFVGADGKPQQAPLIRVRERYPIPLRLLSSDDIEVPLIDLERGRVYEDAKANVKLADDLANKEGLELWKLVKLAVGNFVLTGPKHKRTFALGQGIIPANLPSKNLIELSSNSTTSKFRFAAFQEAVKYCMRIPENVTGIAALAPVTFYIPSADAGSFIDELTPGMQDNHIVKEIKDTGWVVSLAGRTFNVVGDAQLDPADGMCYVRTNVPLGERFDKPGLADMWPDSFNNISAEDRKRNRVLMGMRRVYAAHVPEQWRLGVIGIKYRNKE